MEPLQTQREASIDGVAALLLLLALETRDAFQNTSPLLSLCLNLSLVLFPLVSSSFSIPVPIPSFACTAWLIDEVGISKISY